MPTRPVRPRPIRLACLGDLALDVVVALREPLARGSDTPGSVSLRPGGSAATTARTVARLGGRAVFVGAAGRDDRARLLVAALRRDGVEVRAVRTAARTAAIAVLVEPDGERSFVADRGAADQLRPDDLRPAWFRGLDGLHLPAYSLLNEPLGAAALRAVYLARDAGARISVDLASARPLLAHGRREAWRVLEGAAPDLLFANRAEAVSLAARSDAARALLQLAPVVVLKEGPAGCRVLARQPGTGSADYDVLELTVATTPLETPDTTGAGDAFDGGFLHAWLSGAWDASAPQAALLRRAAVAGNRAAARLLSSPRGELDV
ncbi:MAG TPA: carbohydrate kinase family protein [Candidatus Limnocylindrales bacterium]|nr:carbohydrate kinase family protein [Candidatus Limnocylindrales bacterium]